ncbi:MAG: cobyric acid synthase [Methanomassiliicoccales archaeon]|nr:MAG: cobyric acid synthase [Methanomassiliicoccales archaeon]
MFQATSSSAGKSTLTAGLCRLLARKGVSVAPFKAQNLSLNSFVTVDGGEIGISQAHQAWACGTEPHVDMNPVLLKPKGRSGMQVIVNGRPYKEIGPDGEKVETDELIKAVKEAYSRLISRYDVIVIEGSGSPAEVNLRGRDIANMTTARITSAPVILVGDIDKGGVFAGLFGTYSLLSEDEKRMVKGFIINRFRGDASILKKGVDELERRLSCPCLGIMPYLRLNVPAEDSMELGKSGPMSSEGDVRDSWSRSLDLLADEMARSLDIGKIENLIAKG